MRPAYLDSVDGGGGHGGYGLDELVGVDRRQVQAGHPHPAPRTLAVRPAILSIQN